MYNVFYRGFDGYRKMQKGMLRNAYNMHLAPDLKSMPLMNFLSMKGYIFKIALTNQNSSYTLKINIDTNLCDIIFCGVKHYNKQVYFC